ncbi:MAG: hypothetical protein ACLPY5_16585 [Candidatus Bathyarchaeia archaeon]
MTSPAQGPIDLLTSQSIFILVFGFAVGYITCYLAYRWAGKLHIWHKLSDFDKAMRTLIIGGCISVLQLEFGYAPLGSNDLPTWYSWFSRSWFAFALIILMSAIILQLLFSPTASEMKPETTPETRNDRCKELEFVLMLIIPILLTRFLIRRGRKETIEPDDQ